MATAAGQEPKGVKRRGRDIRALDQRSRKAKRLRRTDFYLEWMRQSEGKPEFAGFSKGEVLNGFTPDVAPLFNVDCLLLANYDSDQYRGSPPVGGVLIGMDKGTLFLWPRGTKLNWIARKDGYPSEEDALFSARALYTAAEAWNLAMAGRVEFVYTDFFTDACFQLAFGGDSEDGLHAQAFSPDDYKEDLNDVFIYSEQLNNPMCRPKTANVFAHELGHVLGLRHAHAQESLPGTPGQVEDDGIESESVYFGSKPDQPTDDSIMAYTSSLRLHLSDVYYAREVYDQLSNSKVTRDGNGKMFQGPGVGPDGQKVIVEKEVLVVPPDN